MPPPILYHYTSADGLIGMLSSNSLWASQIRFMNDKSEWDEAWRVARELLQRRQRSNGHSARLAEMLLAFSAGDEMVRSFAVSFSENGDLLSQWRGYCPAGGYSIGLDSNSLVDAAGRHGFHLYKCVYDIEAKRALLNELFDQLDEATQSQQWPLDDGPRRETLEVFYRRIRDCAAFFKNSGFSEEAEWRLVGNVSAGNSLSRWRARGAAIVPYAVLELPVRDICQEIVISPNVNEKLATHAIRFLLMHYGRMVPPMMRPSASTLV